MTTKSNQHSSTTLAAPLEIRHAKWADLEFVAQLILDVCTLDGDPDAAISPDELRTDWGTSDFNPETDAWVVTTPEGRVVGYEDFYCHHAHASMQGDGYVHPDFMGKGVGTTMLRAMEERARTEMELADPAHRVFIRNGLAISDTAACEMHEAEGFKPIRYTWRMETTLEEPPPTPAWPESVTLRPFDLEQHDYLVYQARQVAFQDSWGFVPRSYAFWQHHMHADEALDPSLWHIAWDGDQIAGFALCRYRNDNGWVDALGVRRPWRKLGLGLALLQRAFGEFYQRGTQVIGLGVDASNPTGATRLYQKAGMQVASEYVIYEKELRPGNEPEVET